MKSLKELLHQLLTLLSAACTFAASTVLFDLQNKKRMNPIKPHQHRHTRIRLLAYAITIASLILLAIKSCAPNAKGKPLQGCISMIVGDIAIIATKQGQVEVPLKKLPPQAKVNDTVNFEASKVNGKWKWVKFKELEPLPIEDWPERKAPSL